MPSKSYDINALKTQALQVRREILETLEAAGSGHPGGSLSAVEIFLALYGVVMDHRPNEPRWEGRDRLVVSKGHVTPVVYVTLANFGYFPKEELRTFRKFGSRLQGHVHYKVPGVEFNTGSLGHGLAIAAGMAGIYPAELPGGWHLVGRTGARLFDPSNQDQPALFRAGDGVQFTPVGAR